MIKTFSFKLYFTLLVLLSFTSCFPDQGRWIFDIAPQQTDFYAGVAKSLYEGSKVSIKVTCEPTTDVTEGIHFEIGWVLRQTPCYEEYLGIDMLDNGPETILSYYYKHPDLTLSEFGYKPPRYLDVKYKIIFNCTDTIYLLSVPSKFRSPAALNHTSVLGSTENVKGKQMISTEKSPVSEADNTLTQKKEKLDETPEQNRRKRNAGDIKLSAEGKSEANKKYNQPQPPPENKEKDLSASQDIANKLPAKSGSTTITSTQVPDEKSRGQVLKSASDSSQNVPAPEPQDKIASPKTPDYLAAVDQDGVYLLVVNLKSVGENKDFRTTVDIKLKGDYGFLSAIDWPLLPFYGVMCGVYVVFAVAWLVVSALQWRDLLRIQFWIMGVIFLGMIEKAIFYSEYQSINSTGQSVKGAVLLAELLSCAKRTLARMLVIIVSLGFGIVKPRLGPMLHRVVGVGALYFILGTVEAWLRIFKPKSDPSHQVLMAGIPLAVLDSAICWWIFSCLVQTTRTLRLRRNIVKLSLYRHFTNTLIFAVLASVAFMIWAIYNHKLTTCVEDWKELWVDEAYWHLLFSVVLLVIMILWRPTINNQRYAFTPLLDALDDDDDDEELEKTLTNDAFGTKMRSTKTQNSVSPKQKEVSNNADEVLKWVEENIPSSVSDSALPTFLDSDEEIMTAKFERNKME
ncbi:transmembrane protein 87A-like isoform X2 [Limulus polyphemus]|uniref:Transmembrane protein 87A-like isoform X2 n=1 Tax=Limulus polyphemus TaxID=6850 RepID=A0ABM1BBP4_LIMPO|nr:transmembrane protein 87A-like isoform X2 [Limulus polyphemus]